MELNGEVLVGAPRDRVWEALNDTEVLRRCIPGCEAMAATGEHEKTATVAVKIGPVRARFNGRVRMEDIRHGEGCTLQFEGQGGAAGMARGSSRVELSDEDGGTRLRYQTQASVAGKLGQVGGRMIDAGARQMADQFFATFQAEVAPAAAAVAEAGQEAAPESVEGTLPAQTSEPAPELAAAQPQGVPAGAAVTAAAGTAPPAGAPANALPAQQPRLPVPRPAPAPASVPTGEGQRVLWFVLGSLSTGFGVWLARTLFS
jgi:carbon monoxide dehydrogenase subunit G